MRNFIIFIFVLFAASSQAQSNKDSLKAEVKAYNKKKLEDFKNENLWYRTWNRFEINPGFSKYALGRSYTVPMNKVGSNNITRGIHYRNSHLEMTGSLWVSKEEKTDSVVDKGSRFSIGYFTPINKLAIGNRYLDVKGFLLQPVVGVGVSYTDAAYGIYVSPGYHLQLPYSVISVRLNADYTFGKGFNVFPELSIQLDALKTLMNPLTVKTGRRTDVSRTATPIGGGWYNVSTSSTSYNTYIKDIGPFWGITPRYGFFNGSWASEGPNIDVRSYGIGVSGRYNILGGDISIVKGQLITGVSSKDNVDPTVKTKFEEDKVRGIVNTTEISFDGSINIGSLIIKTKGATPLNRLSFHLGVSRIIPGSTTYEDETAALNYTNKFFSDNPDIERNATNDPLQHESEWGVITGMSYEMGVLGLRTMAKFTGTTGSAIFIEVYYILPITRILKVYKK